MLFVGTTIISDCWKGYFNLGSDYNYKHLTVNHSKNFVDPETGACTNIAEGTWFQVKRTLPQSGRYKDHLASYLAAFMWRRQHNSEDIFEAFIDAISEIYPPK